MKCHSPRSAYLPPGLLLLLAAGGLRAATLQVPGQYADLPTALSHAADLDTIVLAPGTYTGVFVINKSVVIQGSGAANTFLNANHAGPTVTIPTAKSVTLADVTITGGVAPITFSYGGGIYNQGNLTVFRGNITGNTADTAGGGVSNIGGNLTMYDTTVEANTTAYGGGGIDNEGVMRLERCNVANNTVDSVGGGILNSGDLELVNCTIGKNSAQQGGGIYNVFGTVDATNITVAFNTGAERGGGVVNLNTFTAANSIFATNNAAAEADFAGVMTSADYNIIQTPDGLVPTGATAHIKNVNPNLGQYADAGGYTKVLPLQSPSAAIDGGPSAAGSYPLLDGRAAVRPAGASSDIGAFEYGATQYPDLNNVYVDKNWVTPQLGSEPYPFDSVSKGVAAVRSGGSVFIKPNTYPENIDTSKPMDLRINGTGAVIIGQ